ncbi:MAG: peptide chain release factor N(5)-glutamine methyltransferase [Lautropia sp.]
MPSYDELLAASGLPRLESRLLMAHASGLAREALLARGDRPCPATARERFDVLAARRRRGEPIAYLLGEREFYGRVFRVDARVLIPRPDTETLVDAALARIARLAAPRVLDLGTGSGAIAVTLALERPDAVVVATDRAQDALDLAAQNAARLGARVEFRQGDWWAALATQQDAAPAPFDLVVSNPPYIAEDDPHLAQGDLRHEPRDALTPGGDGRIALSRIVAGARAHLRVGGWLLLEHGHDQGAVTRAACVAAGFDDVATFPDLAGRDRVTGGRSGARPGPRHVRDTLAG